MDKAKQFLIDEFKAGRCKGITENPTPDFELDFYNDIVKLMKRYTVYCEIAPLTELSGADYSYEIRNIKAADEAGFIFQLNELSDAGVEVIQVLNTMYGMNNSMTHRVLFKVTK